MKSNITHKSKHKNTPVKRLISIVIDRYLAAPASEQKAIVEFFNWAVRNSYDLRLRDFHIEVRTRLLEVPQQ